MNEISNIHAFEDEDFLHACFVWGMAVLVVFAVCLVPVFMLLGVVSVAGLAFAPLMDFTASTAAAGRVAAMVLVLYILSTIGFDASCIYYDAFLTDVTTE